MLNVTAAEQFVSQGLCCWLLVRSAEQSALLITP